MWLAPVANLKGLASYGGPHSLSENHYQIIHYFDALAY